MSKPKVTFVQWLIGAHDWEDGRNTEVARSKLARFNMNIFTLQILQCNKSLTSMYLWCGELQWCSYSDSGFTVCVPVLIFWCVKFSNKWSKAFAAFCTCVCRLCTGVQDKASFLLHELIMHALKKYGLTNRAIDCWATLGSTVANSWLYYHFYEAHWPSCHTYWFFRRLPIFFTGSQIKREIYWFLWC